jgi:hypothetical protein
LDKLCRIYAAEKRGDNYHQDRESAAADSDPASAHTSAVFDIRTLPLISPTHPFFSRNSDIGFLTILSLSPKKFDTKCGDAAKGVFSQTLLISAKP